ncbi:hypothetical protein [Candidatus Poriferisocius sp.]|uniref:hypothetical protein n=1 Tax=Candidatus Poriferisocius sp. TaxID=3101276 RepID=UPI003B027F63
MNNKHSSPENPMSRNDSFGRDDSVGHGDPALGEALSEAICRRVDGPAVRPPVGYIAERAAAHARARNIRRAVVGIVASTALLVGGIVAWNSVDREQTTQVVVANEPTTGPVPETTSGNEPPNEFQNLPRAEIGEGSGPVTPEALSTGKALEWTEFNPASVFGADAVDIYGIASVGDGRVLVRVDGGSGGSRAMVSRDGTTWTAVSLPPDFVLERLDITGDRWLATGWALDSSSTSGRFNDHRAFFSDDRGATWTDLAFETASSGESQSGTGVMVSGKNMVIATMVLLPERGGSHTRLYYSNGDPLELVAEYPAQQVAGYSTPEGFYLTLLSAETIDAGKLVTSPDGRQWSEASLADGNWVRGITTVTHSTRQWDQPSVPDEDGTVSFIHRFFGHYETAQETIWMLGLSGSDYRFERLDGVYAPVLVSKLPSGLAGVDRLGVGPAGTVVVSAPERVSAASLITVMRGIKDGYELRYNLLEGKFVLRDISTDTVLYEFNTGVMGNISLPEGVWVQMRDAADAPYGAALEEFVFEDPDTGEDLVTFSFDDLEPLADAENSQAVEAADGFERWVGWSSDGKNWGWQTLSDAFDLPDLTYVERELTNVQLAVGENFVIARVQTYETSENGLMLLGQPVRWFIART